jgi:hypothetical protein
MLCARPCRCLDGQLGRGALLGSSVVATTVDASLTRESLYYYINTDRIGSRPVQTFDQWLAKNKSKMSLA